MSDKRSDSLRNELALRTQSNRTGQELVFDPTTGELVLKQPSERLPNPDAAVVDSIADDGFFAGGDLAGTPLVYLQEDQVRELFANPRTVQDTRGAAFGWDDWTVFHAYTHPPRSRPAGLPCRCSFRVVDPPGPGEDDREFARGAFAGSAPQGEEPRGAGVDVLLYLGEDGRLKTRAFLSRSGELTDCAVRFVPERSDLYSRSRGLLETDVLARKSVGIVGLGSGGSIIALELAKAGVGRLVLMDFDRLELANVSRHICGISDLGRYKTFAVRDAIWQKNPFAQVETHEIDINVELRRCAGALASTDLVICASDGNRSRLNINSLSLQLHKTAIFGRAVTRAAGGDVLRVRPFEGPCYSCLFSHEMARSDDQEFSSARQVREALPAYTSEEEVQSLVQVGLSSDIAPISNLMVKLALLELSRGLPSGIASLEEDLVADYYTWANRRERGYQSFSRMEFGFNKPTILRWYGARIARNPECGACGTLSEAGADDGFFG